MDLRRNAPLLAAAVALAGAAGAARACSICGCGDPLLAASDPAAITGVLRLQLDTEYLRVEAGSEVRAGLTDELTQWSYRVNAVYRPVEPLSLMLTLPVVTKRLRTPGGGPEASGSDLTGLGDVEVAARYAFWTRVDLGARRAQELAVSAGSTLPTGRVDARDAAGALIDPHGQLGTGGWGPFLGMSYLLERGDSLLFASVSGRVRTVGAQPDGSRYQYGDALLWSVHGQLRPISRVALDLGIDGRWARADRAAVPGGPTEDVANTGGMVLSAAPGLYVNAVGRFWVFARGQIPFAKLLRGDQDVLPSFTMGLQVQVL